METEEEVLGRGRRKKKGGVRKQERRSGVGSW